MKPLLMKLIFIEEPATVHISVDLLKNLSESSVLSNCFCTLHKFSKKMDKKNETISYKVNFY